MFTNSISLVRRSQVKIIFISDFAKCMFSQMKFAFLRVLSRCIPLKNQQNKINLVGPSLIFVPVINIALFFFKFMSLYFNLVKSILISIGFTSVIKFSFIQQDTFRDKCILACLRLINKPRRPIGRYRMIFLCLSRWHSHFIRPKWR